MDKRVFNSAAVVMAVILMMVQGGFAYALDFNVPECQFTSQPTSDMMQKCQDAASKSGAAMPTGTSMPTMPTSGAQPPFTTPTVPTGSGIPSGIPSGSIPSGSMPSGFDGAGIDFSKFGPVPQGVPGGIAPMFMGRELSGDVAAPMIGRLASALEEIKKNLEEVEDNAQQLRDGQIKIDLAVEAGIKEVRAKYNEAVALFKANDYMGAAGKLQALNPDVLAKQFGAFRDKQGVSTDLLNDIKGTLGVSLKRIDARLEGSDFITAKGDILAQQKILAQTDVLIKAGKKSEAVTLLKNMQKQYGTGQAQVDLLNGTGLSASQITAVLGDISQGIDRTGSALEKIKQAGTTIPEGMQTLYDTMKSLYTEAKSASDAGNTDLAMQKLGAIRDLKAGEQLTTFKDKAFPKDRLKTILQQGNDGSKALHLSIEKAMEFGVDTAELVSLATQLDDILTKATKALAADDASTFLTYMDQARNLNVREKVDAAIRTVAMGRAKEALGKGLVAVRLVATNMEGVITELSKRKGNVSGAQDLLSTIRKSVDTAQSQYDSGDYMNGGRTLDDATSAMTKLANILKDSGVKLTAGQNSSIDTVMKIERSSDLSNVGGASEGKAQGLISSIGQENNFELKFSLGSLSPDLMEKVLAYRTSDKKLIDGIITEIVPLVLEEDRGAILEGKIGLLDESKSTDKTIAVMKSIKGVSQDTLATMTSLNGQARGYTFTSDVASNLEDQFASFNDKIQSGELKDQLGVDGYVQALKDQIAKGIVSSNDQKFKDKLIPARNIDDNNPLFQEMQYLRQDGAVAPDKNGHINLDQKIDKNALASLINKTIDKNVAKGGSGAVTIQDVMKMIMTAYGVKPAIDQNNAGSATKFFNGIGADVNVANFKKQATMKDVAEILTAADQRWGTQ